MYELEIKENSEDYLVKFKDLDKGQCFVEVDIYKNRDREFINVKVSEKQAVVFDDCIYIENVSPNKAVYPVKASIKIDILKVK